MKGMIITSNISFIKTNDNLIVNYYTEGDWILDCIEEDYIPIWKAFVFTKDDCIDRNDLSGEYKFILGIKHGKYYKIDKKKISTSFDLYIDCSMDVDISWFRYQTKSKKYKDKSGKIKSTSSYGNILICFKHFYNYDKLYIDANDVENFKDDGFHLTKSTYERFLKLFPKETETKYLKLASFTRILKEELDVKDYEEIYENYKRKNIKLNSKDNISNADLNNNEVAKYEYILNLLEYNLKKCENGEFVHEDDFSLLIVKIFCLINPKYVKIYSKLNINDYLGVRKNCQVDIALIDYDGNIDLIEVKSPLRYPNIFSNSKYRSHYIPNKELSSCVNQLDQYIKSLTKMTPNEILIKNERLNKDFDSVKAINPNGYIIFGRDKDSYIDDVEQRKADFEIIRNSYKNIVDIITFDDLIRRLKQIIKSFNNKIV